MGMYIIANEEKTEAVIVNDSACPSYPLPIVFSTSDNEEWDGEDIVELVNEFIDWYRPGDVRYIGVTMASDDGGRALHEAWRRFAEWRVDERKRQDAEDNQDEV